MELVIVVEIEKARM